MRIVSHAYRVTTTIVCELTDAEPRPVPWQEHQTYSPERLAITYRSNQVPEVTLHARATLKRGTVTEHIPVSRYPSLPRAIQDFILEHQPKE
jgi:hypothetical protein